MTKRTSDEAFIELIQHELHTNVFNLTRDFAGDQSDVHKDELAMALCRLFHKHRPEAMDNLKDARDRGVAQSAEDCDESLDTFEPCTRFRLPGER